MSHLVGNTQITHSGNCNIIFYALNHAKLCFQQGYNALQGGSWGKSRIPSPQTLLPASGLNIGRVSGVYTNTGLLTVIPFAGEQYFAGHGDVSAGSISTSASSNQLPGDALPKGPESPVAHAYHPSQSSTTVGLDLDTNIAHPSSSLALQQSGDATRGASFAESDNRTVQASLLPTLAPNPASTDAAPTTITAVVLENGRDTPTDDNNRAVVNEEGDVPPSATTPNTATTTMYAPGLAPPDKSLWYPDIMKYLSKVSQQRCLTKR